ncbi:MAG: ATP:cob(I)alamin adenosyltransferase [Candidatus Shapirobacteria bacterium]|nr:ATP:cob(I)alamin adenosyltransferase [Candidatus Shapirobacteria bacterium]
MTITTKTGDGGVSFWKDKRVGKDNILIETIGTLDEVQAIIEMVGIDLEEVKVDLWGIMGEIAYEKKYEKLGERIGLMEHTIDKLDEELPKIDKFIIFKNEKAIKLNWLRTVVRRAERKIVELNKQQPVNPKLLAYINRLSDYLFMIARREEIK